MSVLGDSLCPSLRQIPSHQGNKGEEVSSAQAQPSARGAPARHQHSTAVPLPSDHSATAPAALAQGMSGWNVSPFSPRGGGSAVTSCAGAGAVSCTLLPQELLSLPTPAEPWLAPPSRSRAGPDGNLAPCAAARGRLHDLLSPAQGCAQGQPLPHRKECRTRSVTCEPGCLFHPPERVDHRPIPSYPKGNMSHGRQDFGQASLFPLHSKPAWKTCKENMDAWSPDLTQQRVSSSALCLFSMER